MSREGIVGVVLLATLLRLALLVMWNESEVMAMTGGVTRGVTTSPLVSPIEMVDESVGVGEIVGEVEIVGSGEIVGEIVEIREIVESDTPNLSSIPLYLVSRPWPIMSPNPASTCTYFTDGKKFCK
jgi:hypothetical protein